MERYTATLPRPEFWKALSEGRFELPCCGTCGEWQPAGAARCWRCGSARLEWAVASGRGMVYSLLERLAAPGLTPVFIVVVELDEGPTMMGAIAVPGAHAEVGMRVRVVDRSAPTADGLVLFTQSAN